MKWLVGALATLVAVCIGLGCWVRSEVKQNNALQAYVIELNDKLAIAANDLKKTQESCFVTDRTVSDYTIKVEGLDATALDINNTLDKSLAETVKQTQVKTDEAQATINTVTYRTNAVLSDSMWNTYCSVQPNDSDCTSRKLTH